MITPEATHAAEQGLLGLLLTDPAAYDTISDGLQPVDFGDQSHQTAYAALCAIYERGLTPDAISTAETIVARHGANWDHPKSPLAYLSGLAIQAPGSRMGRQYRQIIVEASARRRVIAIGRQLATIAGDPSSSLEELVTATETRLATFRDATVIDPADAAEELANAYDRATDPARRTSGLQLGIPTIDGMLGGARPGQLIVVGARPSVGKTALGCHIANHLFAAGRRCLMFSLEMTRDEIADRLLALRAGTSLHTIRTGQIAENDHGDLLAATHTAGHGQLSIDDRSSVTTSYIRSRAKRHQRRSGLDAIIVDYLGLLRGQGENRTQEVASISRDLKAIAKDLGVPVIALAQLNRDVERRDDRRPMLSDLRDSGSVEQDADAVLMIHREEKHLDDGVERDRWRGLAELLLRKNRNGPTGEATVRFSASTGRFTAFDGPSPRLSAQPKALSGFQPPPRRAAATPPSRFQGD